MFALIQSKNHASKKGKRAGRYKFDTHPTRIGLKKTYFLPYGGSLTESSLPIAPHIHYVSRTMHRVGRITHFGLFLG